MKNQESQCQREPRSSVFVYILFVTSSVTIDLSCFDLLQVGSHISSRHNPLNKTRAMRVNAVSKNSDLSVECGRSYKLFLII